MTDRPPLIPPPLRPGDCIGLFAPAGPVRDHAELDRGIAVLHGLGFQTKQPVHRQSFSDYLAAPDHARLDELHDLLRDESVRALMAVRGGFGCLRIMAGLDFDHVRRHPKLIIGFSDISILLNSVTSRTGLVTLHGPVVTSLARASSATILALADFLAGRKINYAGEQQIKVLRSGRATGVIRGGNLTSLVHLLNTPWEVDWPGSLLFLEDTGESMYRLDRMLTQLYHAGALENLAGIILGSFDSMSNGTKERDLAEFVGHRLLELTRRFDYPVWTGFPLGHRETNFPVPIGRTGVMDSDSASLRLAPA